MNRTMNTGNNHTTRINNLDIYIYILLIISATVLRLYLLDLRTFHHDESAVGSYTYKLFDNGEYHYNPVFHGPFIYFLTSWVFELLGDTEFAARLVPALTGMGMVLLIYPIRHYLGRPGWLIAAAFLAFSPSFLYYSRFFRNDIFIAFFTLAVIVCCVKYLEQGDSPRRLIFVFLGSAALGLSATAKENTYVIMALFAFPVGLFILYKIIMCLRRHSLGHDAIVFIEKNKFRIVMDTGLFVIVFLIIFTLFYSYFFKDIEAVTKAPVEAFSHWYEMHDVERIGGPPYYYIPLLMLYELPIFLFAVVGSVEYIQKFVRKRENVFMAFMVYWLVANMAAYSYLGEKVPWLLLHPLLPAILVAGAYMGELLPQLRYRPRYVEVFFITVIVLSVSFFLFTSYSLNYTRYSDPAEPLIQASQPPQKFQDFLTTLHETARRHDGYDTEIQNTDPKMNTQFLWHLRHYTNIKWFEKLENNPDLDAPIIVVHDEDVDIAQNLLIGDYQRLDSARMAWYFYNVSDINYKYILFREIDRPSDEYGIILFYR